MKATLHFDDPEELQDALDGWKWKNAVHDLDNEMRSVIKHGYWHNREATDVEIDVTEYWREKLRELVTDNNLNLNI
jgi:hypothetical protein